MKTEGTQFEILNRVDVGGMAEIFRAKNLSTGEIMAIKRILPSLAGQENFVSMFIDEAAVCMALHHPNIVRVDQIGLMDDALFLSMEFVAGMNLRDLLNFANQYQFKLPIHEAVRIAALILDGLEYAHHVCGENGEPLNLIHRDISPPNILLGYNGDVKITDFGLVKSKSQLSKTVPGLIKGKFSYLSPEAAYGESIDHRSDLYAVGIILWEMLASRPLFNDPIETKILDLVRKSIVPPISSINEDVPEALEKIINKGLARSRADRYQTAREFADDLRGFLKSIGNPESALGDIVAKIKPPQDPDENEDEEVEAPQNATAADDEVQPHTRSELIPIEALVKAADEAEKKEDELKAKTEREKTAEPAQTEDDEPKSLLDKWREMPSAMKKKDIILACIIVCAVIFGIMISISLFF